MQNIVIAPRAYSKDDARQINSNFSLVGNKAQTLSKNFIVFDSKQEVVDSEKKVAAELKSLF